MKMKSTRAGAVCCRQLLQSIRLHTEPCPVVSGLHLSTSPAVHSQAGLFVVWRLEKDKNTLAFD